MLTAEQRHLCNTSLKRGDVAIVRAFAGTGKTFSIREFAKAWLTKRICLLYFNAAMAAAAEGTFPPNVDVFTAHAMGMRRFAASRYQGRRFGNIAPIQAMRVLGLSTMAEAKAAVNTLTAWLSTTDEALELKHVSFAGGKVTPSAILEMAVRLARAVRDPNSGLPVPFDYYLKEWVMTGPDFSGYDILIVDEAQDSNPLVIRLAQYAREKHGVAVMFVGDSHQNIYEWRGTANALEVCAQLAGADTKHLSLTTSFRYSDETARKATALLRKHKSIEDRIRGDGRPPEGRKGAYIARANATLLEIARALTEKHEGIRLHFAGTDQRDEWNPEKVYRLDALADATDLRWRRLKKHRCPNMSGFSSWESIEEYLETTEDPEVSSILKMAKDESPASVEQLRQRLVAAATSPKGANMTLTSAHRAKGLEWDRICLCDDFPNINSGKAMQRYSFNARVQEVNLAYVALTRSRGSIKFRDEEYGKWLEENAACVR